MSFDRNARTLAEVVDMPGDLRVLESFHATRASDGMPYRVDVYECGEFAGDVHWVGDEPKVRNCFRQSGHDALEFMRDRWWPLAQAFEVVQGIGKLRFA